MVHHSYVTLVIFALCILHSNFCVHSMKYVSVPVVNLMVDPNDDCISLYVVYFVYPKLFYSTVH